MSRELLKQALYALKYHSIQTRPIDLTNETIEALRQELAKPEQEHNFDMPEAHIVKWSIPVDPNNFGEPLAQPEQESISTNDHLCAMLRQVHDVLACTALPMKRQWVGLTDDEIKEVLDLNVAPWSLSGVALQHVMDDARALEAKLKEKNA